MISAVSGSSGFSCYSYGASFRTGNNAQQDLQKAAKIQSGQVGGTQASGRIVGAQKAAQTGVPVQPITPVTSVSVEGARQIDLELPVQRAAEPAELANRMRVQYGEGVSMTDSAQQVQKLAESLSAEAAKGMESAAVQPENSETSGIAENAGLMDPAELSARMRIQYDGSDAGNLKSGSVSENPSALSMQDKEGSSTVNGKNLSRVSGLTEEESQTHQIQMEREKSVQNVQSQQREQKIKEEQNETVPAFAAA